MKRSAFGTSSPCPFERVSDSYVKVPRLIPADALDEVTGDIVNHQQIVEIDNSIPQTPQTGVECLSNDLAFLVRSGRELPSASVGLSMFSSGNPFENYQKVRAIADSLGTKYGETFNKDEKK